VAEEGHSAQTSKQVEEKQLVSPPLQRARSHITCCLTIPDFQKPEMPVILRKNISKQKLLWVFSSLHVCATLFYKYNHKSRGIIFNYKCWTAVTEAMVGFEEVPLTVLKHTVSYI
jgi:hypothetical protein